MRIGCCRWWWSVVLLGAGLSQVTVAAAHGPEVTRRDWYFRETLPAIRDWETVLTRWEQQTPEAERSPVFPVPASGEQVAWPNPIPFLLLPAEDQAARLRIRLTGLGRLELEQAGGDGRTVLKTNELGAIVQGYKHPGGGAKDHWYHSYHRRFDRWTTFRGQRAPFLLKVDGPLDFGLGRNRLSLFFRNISASPLALTVGGRALRPTEERSLGERSLALSVEAEETVSWPLQLDQAGGGAVIVELRVGEKAWWLPLFWHVEDVPAVLRSVGQILADTPDEQAEERLGQLRQRAAGLLKAAAPSEDAAPLPGADAVNDPCLIGWRVLFEEASALREELLLARLRFDTLLFVKRKPYISEQPFMDAHHLFNRPGGGIYRLSPVRPDGRVTPVVDSLGEGVYRDVCLHWDANRLLFSFGNGSDKWDGSQSYHLYEIGVDGQGLRQLTRGPKNDCEPFYLPHGQIGFTSDRSEHFVMCGGDRHVANLFVMQTEGSGLRQLSYNMFNEFTPSVLPDGRILYSRWEYNERSVTSLHKLFTMNADGTQVAPYYGNATIRPNVTMFSRAVPGSHKVMTLFTAHHGQTHGPIALVDSDRGVDGEAPITLLTPDVPVTGEKAEDSRYGWFSDPTPLSESVYLCSFTPTVQPWLERSWALYVGDRHGNLALVYRDPVISCAEPVPLVSRTPPHRLPAATDDTDATDADAALLLMDVYVGLPGVPRGEAKFLRILEDVPRKDVREGGVIVTGATSIYTVKRILGTVPIEPDGSAYFLVPANRNVYFEALDGQHREIQRMRSVICLKPNEQRTCVGCHEHRQTSPPNRAFQAAARVPSRPEPPPWGDQTLSFLRDVQPVLNAKCLGCHTYDRPANKVILTDDLTDQFNVAYQELVGYLSLANAMRWDHPDDVRPRPPFTYGSKVSPLARLLEAGHYDVQLTDEEWWRLRTWIDANGIYYDRYEQAYGGRHIFNGAQSKALEEVHARRCAGCHGRNGDGRHDTWALSLNRHDVSQSRALKAPLSRQAGGWERCEETVFTNTSDPDYQKLLAALSAIGNTLAARPRADLLSLRDSPALQQKVVYPDPPPRRSAPPEDILDGDWVYLSDLPWESARAGWTPNRDGLPRRDRDIEESRLRLGTRTYRKGLGTHAPSEILYPLKGQYERLVAIIGGAEAGGTVEFQVYGDDKLLYQSGLLQGLGPRKEIDLDLQGVQRLRLVVTDAGDGYNADVANWAGARLRRTGQAQSR